MYYSVGKVAVTQGSQTVTGTYTHFDSTSITGDVYYFRVKGTGNPTYKISSINSATSLTLEVPYGGETATSVSYMILYDTTPNLYIPKIKEYFSDKEDIGRKAILLISNAIKNTYD